MAGPAVFAAPLRYVQGPGALDTLAEELSRLKATSPLVLCDPAVRGALEHRRSSGTMIDFNGEASPGEIDRVAGAARDAGADALVGVGGGKTLDTAKAVAHPAELPLVVVPTIASTDAPTSSLSVIYDDDGAFLEYRFYGRNPDVVLVDTAIIAQAPVRFLVAGIGDGLSTFFEADASATTRKPAMAGGPPLLAATTLARLCYDTLLADGLAARARRRARRRDAGASSASSRPTRCCRGSGFESGGLAAAHSIHNGLTVLHETHDYWHGEKVAIGVIALLVLEGRPQALVDEVVDFCLRVGLPVTLATSAWTPTRRRSRPSRRPPAPRARRSTTSRSR